MRATDILRDDHATVKQMFAELAALGPRDGDAGPAPNTTHWERSFGVLMAAVLRHIDAEEMALFADAERLGDEELERLGDQIRARSEALRGSLGQRTLRKLRQLGRKTA